MVKKTLAALAIASMSVCGMFTAHSTALAARVETIHATPQCNPQVLASSPIYSAAGHQIGLVKLMQTCYQTVYSETVSTNGPYTILSCLASPSICNGPTAGVTVLDSPVASVYGCPEGFTAQGYITDSTGTNYASASASPCY